MVRAWRASILVVLFAVGSVLPASAWVKGEEVSKVDGRKKIWISVRANEPITGWLAREVTPELVIICEGQVTVLYVNWRVTMDGRGQTVTYRLEGSPAQQAWWSGSTDYQALGLWGGSAIPFIQRMMKVPKLFVRARAYNAGDVETSFDLSGLAEEIKPIQDLCKWPGRKP